MEKLSTKNNNNLYFLLVYKTEHHDNQLPVCGPVSLERLLPCGMLPSSLPSSSVSVKSVSDSSSESQACPASFVRNLVCNKSPWLCALEIEQNTYEFKSHTCNTPVTLSLHPYCAPTAPQRAVEEDEGCRQTGTIWNSGISEFY